MSETHLPFDEPFNVGQFRSEGHKLVDTLANYLDVILKGKDIPVLPWKEPDELAREFSFKSAGGENEPFNTYLSRVIEHSNHLHHPRYIGHQVTSPLPMSVLAQFCTTLLNNASAVYEMGPVNMAMERNVVRRFGELIGYEKDFDGIFTHGGTVGNLTAMLAARQVKAGYNIWDEGVREKQRPGFIISHQSHYSIAKSAKIMGLGEKSIIRIPSDKNYRMKTYLLDELKDKADENGIKVISVVANACSTATGSYDNLNEIADFCEKNDLWLHVDGAHGMGVLFSERLRDRINGIERADSIVIDFHKMFLLPALNTLVMFKKGSASHETFTQRATYLFRTKQDNLWAESALRTIECTKSAMGIIAFTALKYYGKSYYRKYIESRYDLCRHFAQIIKSKSDFELAVEPEANIVCFRFKPEGYDDQILNKLNTNVRERIVRKGSYYIVNVDLNNKSFLRLTIINPLTTLNDLTDLLSTIVESGADEIKDIMQA